MSSPQPGSPLISPDAHYWWDGQAWQPMPAAAPAPAVAVETPPSWLAAAPPQAAAPSAAAVVAYEPTPAPAAWATPQPPASRTWIYLSGLLMIAVIVIGGFVVYPMLRPATNAAAVQATPSPLISDYERADRFLNVDLGPSLVETNQALPGVTSKCTSSLPPPCKDALIVLNKAMIDVDSAIQNNQRDIPVCIGRPVQQFKDDWTGMEQGVSQAISGFNESNRTLIIEGLQHFVAIAKYMKPDVDRINKAQQTCAKTV